MTDLKGFALPNLVRIREVEEMNKMLEGKVAIVTGAGRGIGRGIAESMAAHGAKVVVNDLGATSDGQGVDSGPANETVEAIKKAGGEAIVNGDSVASWDGAHAMVENALSNWGRIDCVVNNAGILRDVIFHKLEEADFDAVVNVHLKGTFNVSRAAAPHFRKQESGAYVHMTSNSGLIGNFGQANYVAAKLGIVGLSKSIALDMSRFNVSSNCISPTAWSRLTGTIPARNDSERDRVEKIKAMTPDKIAPLATYLCSDVANDVTGQIFAVRNNEIFLMSQNRPLRSVHDSDGWTPEKISNHAMPALKSLFYDLDRSADVFCWDPI